MLYRNLVFRRLPGFFNPEPCVFYTEDLPRPSHQWMAGGDHLFSRPIFRGERLEPSYRGSLREETRSINRTLTLELDSFYFVLHRVTQYMARGDTASVAIRRLMSEDVYQGVFRLPSRDLRFQLYRSLISMFRINTSEAVGPYSVRSFLADSSYVDPLSFTLPPLDPNEIT